MLAFLAKRKILATSSATAVPLPDVKDAPEDLSTNSLVQAVEAIEKAHKSLPNPGTFENLLGEVKSVLMPSTFEGFRFDFQRNLGPRFAVNHALLLGCPQIPGGVYQFGATTVVGDGPEPTLLRGQVSHDGSVDARWHMKLSESFKMRAQAQLKQEAHASQAMVDIDFNGADCTANLKVGNGILIGVNYLQSVTKEWAFGGEGYYYGKHRKTITSYVAKYTDPSGKWTGITSYGAQGTWQLHYLRKVSDRVRLATELVYNQPSGEAASSFGVEVDLRQTRFVSSIDHTFKLATALECKVLPQLQLLLSAEGTPAADDLKFGYGFQFMM
ncbi:Mitochondrial Protein Translocase (MPT) Family [Thraustotheca clavata]|uniref:Mitochondrial Protein Translocase (MPT) Family n=1 Tax=Thraustotheca clavata TaxID=74557 RepID=A0A1W0A8R9_9STRA|nr:Mitochondrial Protein Translocase (MPT) Family [Thraustotheca clavata]